MNVTAQNLINNSLEHLGVEFPQFGPGPDVSQSMFLQLNRLMELWQIDNFMVPAIVPSAYTLTSGIQQYTIGPGATGPYAFPTQWPVRIELANIILNNTYPQIRQPLQINTFRQWGDIQVQPIPYAIPQQLWWDRQYPISNLYLWPGPMQSYQLELFMPVPLNTFADLGTTSYNLGFGYAECIELNLAVRAYSRMRLMLKIAMDPVAWTELKNNAWESKRLIERENEPERTIYCEPAYLQNRGARTGFNWLTGSLVSSNRRG